MSKYNKQYFLEQQSYIKDQMYDTLNFWYEHGFDREHGGFYECLDRDGSLWSTDKSVWAQGRALWVFSTAYNKIEQKPEWLEACKATFDFIQNKCIDTDGRMFFTVTGDGKYIQKRRYFFSETFACVGAAELYTATKDQKYLDFARDMYAKILDLYTGKTPTTPKFNPEVVNGITLANPMILMNTTQLLRQNDPENTEYYTEKIYEFFKEIQLHFRPDKNIQLENVHADGTSMDGARGRLVNPGHSIEATWFIMNEYQFKNDPEMLEYALKVLDGSFKLGWDKKYQGMMYFADVEGRPCEALEWDMKLWWPHCEVMISALMAYKLTKDEKYMDMYDKTQLYSFSHFKDEKYGEWFGYLHRDGTVANVCKGNIFKGPFHIPRAMILNYLQVSEILKNFEE